MAKNGKKGSNPKKKTTLFYETFKVQTIKVVLFFLFGVFLTPFWLFSGFSAQNPKIFKKWPKRSQMKK